MSFSLKLILKITFQDVIINSQIEHNLVCKQVKHLQSSFDLIYFFFHSNNNLKQFHSYIKDAENKSFISRNTITYVGQDTRYNNKQQLQKQRGIKNQINRITISNSLNIIISMMTFVSLGKC
ncbi:hypothetical protein TTHERM_000502159 (macronuclear) [Tetrahymena thermophila SB210]|uniref:Uncharacterized protein n=1 Tax=Tetrahymena thermophila (strain SB210) TaxID=312017 RepID=W7X0S4_TETTS|nr:hypothetical protein TTHERM_000502159 [Tetrahymena thermophila SB210]EWS72765.1 hypothetical protein TTHERM_000502159 [Tetrahymena thermophila SB210]|eukprot:XP_012654702.1 hypothetical protein TTHERM_000502159 [Tetrahymena thermophila SB210]